MLHVMDRNLLYGLLCGNVKTNEKGTRDVNGNVLCNVFYKLCLVSDIKTTGTLWSIG